PTQHGQAWVLMRNPGCTGRPRLVISARLAPLPPSRSLRSLLPSAKSYTYFVATTVLRLAIYDFAWCDVFCPLGEGYPPESGSSAPAGTASSSRSASHPAGRRTGAGEFVRPRGRPSTSPGGGT